MLRRSPVQSPFRWSFRISTRRTMLRSRWRSRSTIRLASACRRWLCQRHRAVPRCRLRHHRVTVRHPPSTSSTRPRSSTSHSSPTPVNSSKCRLPSPSHAPSPWPTSRSVPPRYGEQDISILNLIEIGPTRLVTAFRASLNLFKTVICMSSYGCDIEIFGILNNNYMITLFG